MLPSLSSAAGQHTQWRVRLSISPKPVHFGLKAKLTVRSLPLTGCGATVSYPNSKGPAPPHEWFGETNRKGVVAWTWTEESPTRHGTAWAGCSTRYHGDRWATVQFRIAHG